MKEEITCITLSLFDSEEVNSSPLLYSSSLSLLQLPRPISCFTPPHSIRLSKFYTNSPSNFHTINTPNEKSSNFHKLIFQTKNPVTFTQLIFQIKNSSLLSNNYHQKLRN